MLHYYWYDHIVQYHTVEYDPFIKSQLASRNQLQGRVWCKCGHVMFENDLLLEGVLRASP